MIKLLKRIKQWIFKHKAISVVSLFILLIYYFCLPSPLFNTPYSTVINSKDGTLIGAQIATDGQWRFPIQNQVPYKFKMCIIQFEDAYFNYHWGINPISTFKAAYTNFKAKKVIRGGSTLTQQTIRLARSGKKRSYFEKLIEAIQATRLEFKHSKETILNLYAAHAPFGSNVVGLEAAAWRYFGTTSDQLSWAESATLAVLPNAPSLIYPGKNQEILLKKRNTLLEKLLHQNLIDKQTYELSIVEPLPNKPHPLPQLAPHLLTKVAQHTPQQRITTTIDYEVQSRALDIVKSYYDLYSQTEIYNMAVLVLDAETRDIISYIGNTPTTVDHQKDVDIIMAPRSTGSILKPFLYAAMLDDAALLPQSLVPDIPTVISGYKPQNYQLNYDGAVPADQALSRSLNIPFVLMLQDYGIYPFYDQLQKLELSAINKHPNHYGLSLILGGAESSLWDLCKAYASWVATLNHFQKSNGKYRSHEVHPLNWIADKDSDFGEESFTKNTVGAGAIWQTMQALREVNRPDEDQGWKHFDSSLQIAWKTGTSFGGRDAWAIGMDKKHIVGVWIGNATGEGRPSLSGVRNAAPVLFDIFNLLPNPSEWFSPPLNDLEYALVCTQSGYLAKEYCPTKEILIPKRAKKTALCPYHELLHLDETENFQVNLSCETTDNMHTKPWFVLPATMAYYYAKQQSTYKPLPPFREDCAQTVKRPPVFIYPKHLAKIYLAKDFQSTIQPFVAKAATSSPTGLLHWYLDSNFIGTTSHFHELSIKTSEGTHLLTLVDAEGNEATISFEIEQ